MRHSRYNTGFSLVELSIVLVILGLLVGGILAGQHLVAAARLQKMLREIDNYKVAMLLFQERYLALPGDITNATTFWPDCQDNTVHNRCNGNGDGFIGGGIAFYSNEPMRAWEHLSRAGMISGQYDASVTTIHSGYLSIVTSSIGMDTLPKSAFSDDAAYMISRVIFNSSMATHLDGKDFIIVSALRLKNNELRTGSLERLFTPEQAYLIDLKVDDGNARSGSVYSTIQWTTSPPLCSSSAGTYALQFKEPACVLFFEN